MGRPCRRGHGPGAMRGERRDGQRRAHVVVEVDEVLAGRRAHGDHHGLVGGDDARRARLTERTRRGCHAERDCAQDRERSDGSCCRGERDPRRASRRREDVRLGEELRRARLADVDRERRDGSRVAHEAFGLVGLRGQHRRQNSDRSTSAGLSPGSSFLVRRPTHLNVREADLLARRELSAGMGTAPRSGRAPRSCVG